MVGRVAIGIALDVVYAVKKGFLNEADGERILAVIEKLDLPIWHEALNERDGAGNRVVFDGLEEFREHLGGRLTILLLEKPGVGVEVNEMDEVVLDECVEILKKRAEAFVGA